MFVYSRAGYGKSSSIALPRPLDYMQREATEVLPQLLDAIGFRRGILLGHSDGATIAAWYAGSVQDHRVRGLVLIAPHFFMEASNIAAIRKTVETYETTDLRAKLARHHADVDAAFRGWSGAWLDPGFETFDTTDALAYIRVPILVLQGAADPYGTLAQVRVRGRGMLLPGGGGGARRASATRRIARTLRQPCGISRISPTGSSGFTAKALKTLRDFSLCARLPAAG